MCFQICRKGPWSLLTAACAVEWPGGKGPARVTLPVGECTVIVRLGGVRVFAEEVRILTGTEKAISIKTDGVGSFATRNLSNQKISEHNLAGDRGSSNPARNGTDTTATQRPATGTNHPTPRTSGRVAEGWVSLFNGRDKTGWKTHPSQPDNWQVKDGVLAASGPDVSHLYSERGDYRDIHLRVERGSVTVPPGG